ncbi:helicase C-terminal domain-containing protein [Dapis sp. BLCC M172]|uniref:helicase C-terminal domain-containing protein n=1 Tax=Dapis sp. BLCC M172 TaxID=2975281 RepID=UPI003CF6DFED
MREQGEGSFLEIKDSESDTLLPVPYWSWQDKKYEVAKALESANKQEIANKKDDKNKKSVMFTWPLIKDNLENCQCFISGKELEISTILTPISQFGTFSKAEHRILMSATTQNDSFFVKGLGLNIEAVRNPLINQNEKWSGEKMILIPWLIHEELKETYIINKFAAKDVNRQVGCVAITSSFKRAETYKKLGSIVVKSDNIFQEIEKLKSGDYSNTIVFANRYDGIDLPDDSCRILIIDYMPYSSSLTERYEEEYRSNSDLINIKNAQKIEQGLGRSVRGDRDYSVIIINGNDLVKFIKSRDSNNFFFRANKKADRYRN